MKKLILLVLPFTFSFTMCGHRGAPKPPLSYRPETPKVYNPIQDYDSPLVVWEKVTRFDDGRKILDPSKVTYYVRVNFGEKVIKVKNYWFRDKPIKSGQKRCYSISADYLGKRGSWSEPVCLVGRIPIKGVPKVKELVEGDGFVKIILSPSKYTVEVFKNGKEPFFKPYKILKAYKDVFTDKDVENGKIYTYRLRFSDGSLKGKLSPPFVAKPLDRRPPKPPNSALLIKGEKCLILWEPSPSKDVIFYKVVFNGKTYTTDGIYLMVPKCPNKVKVYAVDKGGNLSKPAVGEVVDEKGSSLNGKQIGPSSYGELH